MNDLIVDTKQNPMRKKCLHIRINIFLFTQIDRWTAEEYYDNPAQSLVAISKYELSTFP